MALRVLLATTAKWLSTARLAVAMAETGCVVEAVCPPGHPLHHTTACVKRYGLSLLRPEASLEEAIRASRAELIVSCDEKALELLCMLDRRADAELHGRIQTSIGETSSIETALARSALLTLAAEEGIAIPRSSQVSTTKELQAQIEDLGLPFVLKADMSAGGQGVRVVNTEREAETLWERLRGPVSLPRTLNRLLLHRDRRHLAEYFERRKSVVMAQEFINGREGNVGASCWKGEMVASIAMEVVHTCHERGPSSVLRAVNSPAMLSAARTLVRRLNFTGFCGFDFIFDRDGVPLLLEMNARPTQIAHLALGTGGDLVANFLAAASGTRVAERHTPAKNDLIALFPHEWRRDPTSTLLRDAYHDVPWQEPGLVQAAIDAPVARGAARAYDSILTDLGGFAARFRGSTTR